MRGEEKMLADVPYYGWRERYAHVAETPEADRVFLMKPIPLILNRDDPSVVSAQAAEEQLYRDYGLEPEHHDQLLRSSGMRVRVSIVGAGPPLVIVPGNTGDVFPLIPLMAAIPGRQLIGINRPGGGLSDGMDHRMVDMRAFAVETLETILDAIELRDADILAHSIGAHWSLWLAMDRPTRVRRLVTLGNPGNVLSGGPPLTLRLLTRPPFSWILGRRLSAREGQGDLRMLRMMGHDLAALQRLPASFAACYAAFRALPNYKISLLSLMQNAPAQITANELARVEQPVSLIWGTNDSFGTAQVGRMIADAVPIGTLHTIPEAGHLPWLEDPELCGEIVTAALA